VETGAGDQGASLGIESTADAREGKKTQETRRRRRRRRRGRDERGTQLGTDPRPPPRGGEAGGGEGNAQPATRNKSNERAAKQLGEEGESHNCLSVPSGADVPQTGGESSPLRGSRGLPRLVTSLSLLSLFERDLTAVLQE